MARKEKITLTRDELLVEIAESIRRPEKEENEFSTYDIMPLFPGMTRSQIRDRVEKGVREGKLSKRNVLVAGRNISVYKRLQKE